MLFAGRLEVWNPGTLPPSLTVEMTILGKPKSSRKEYRLTKKGAALLTALRKGKTKQGILASGEADALRTLPARTGGPGRPGRRRACGFLSTG